MRQIFAGRRFDTDYSSFRTTLLVVGLLLLGGSRLSRTCGCWTAIRSSCGSCGCDDS